MQNEQKIIMEAKMTRDPLLKGLVSEYNKKKELKKPVNKVIGQIKDRILKLTK